MILSGRQLSDELTGLMAEEVATFPAKYGRVPHLAVILVGNDPASVTYVRNKARASALIGIKNTTINLKFTLTKSPLSTAIILAP